VIQPTVVCSCCDSSVVVLLLLLLLVSLLLLLLFDDSVWLRQVNGTPFMTKDISLGSGLFIGNQDIPKSTARSVPAFDSAFHPDLAGVILKCLPSVAEASLPYAFKVTSLC
jgi:hypothetical protein